MSVSIDGFVRLIESVAPPELAEDWDNTGLLLRCGESVSRVLIALDVTDAVAQEAVESGCDMILAHHPLLFEPARAFDHRLAKHSVLMRLIRSGISLYAAHTSFDKAQGGINDALSAALGLSDVTVAQDGLMRIGRLPKPCDKEAFLRQVRDALGGGALRVSHTPEEMIEAVAVVGGSGGDFVTAAKAAGAQALVTGEAKHHHFIEAAAHGILLIEAGHFETECLFSSQIFMSLQARLNEVQLGLALMKSKCEMVPYAVI